MYAIKKIASIHIISAGCYFEDYPLGLVEPNLRPSLEDTSSNLLSYWSTVSSTNSPRAGPAATMVDVGDCKNRYIVQKKEWAGFLKTHSTFAFRASWMVEISMLLSKSSTFHSFNLRYLIRSSGDLMLVTTKLV